MNELGIKGDSALARTMSKSNEWYTPLKIVQAVKRVLGPIELDPASCEAANKLVQAQRYYTLEVDGLRQSWKAKTIYLNPPYGRDGSISNQDVWTMKLIQEYEEGNIEQAILLVSAATDAGWFHRLLRYRTCLTKGRIRFVTTTNSTLGPTIGSAFVYFGMNEPRFKQVFKPFGTVLPKVVDEEEPTLWSA